MKARRPLVLLDRDGTLMEEHGYLTDHRKVGLLPGAVEGLIKLKKSGFRLVVVSNQSGVGRGLITKSQLDRVNHRFLELLGRENAPVDGLYWCPHRPESRCSCRKPKLGLVKRAARDLKVSWQGSISVGDRPSDVELGQRTGGLGVLVLSGYGRKWGNKPHKVRPDHTARDFRRAADWIIRHGERKKS